MKHEITWEELNNRLGKSATVTREKTTVTHKIRRIAEWDDELFEQSCILNHPTQIALTFADYIDPRVYGSDKRNLVMNSAPIRKFMEEHNLDGRVNFIGTGPDTVVEV